MLPFNLSKTARRNPPTAFNPSDPLLIDPYRKSKGKPNSGAGDDLLRPGETGGGPFSQNKEWPTDQPFITDDEGRPKNDNGTGIVTDYGLELHDDYQGQGGSSGSDAALGRNQTVTRQIDDNRDRKPFNLNGGDGVLRGLRKRLRNI